MAVAARAKTAETANGSPEGQPPRRATGLASRPPASRRVPGCRFSLPPPSVRGALQSPGKSALPFT